MFCRSNFGAMEQNLGAETDMVHVNRFANQTPSIANPQTAHNLCIPVSLSPGSCCFHASSSRSHREALCPSLWMGGVQYGAQASVSEIPPGKTGALLLTDHKSGPHDTSAEDSSLHTYTQPSADVGNNNYVMDI